MTLSRKLKITAFLAILALFRLAVAEPSLNEVRKFKDTTAGLMQIIRTETFEQQAEKVNYPKGFRLDPHGGINGNGGLLVERTDPKEYTLVYFGLPKLEPGQLYTAEVWARMENMKADKTPNVGIMCLEYFKDGKWYFGAYPTNGVEQDGEWRKYTMEFQQFKDSTNASVILYMNRGFTGKIWFDDLQIKKAGDSSMAIIPNRPDMLNFRGSGGEIAFTTSGNLGNPGMWVTLENNGKSQDLLLKRNRKRFHGQVNGLVPGPVKVTARLVDFDKRAVTLTEEFKMNCIAANTPEPAGACRFDEYGRLLVDGKPFMPLGFFGSNLKESDLQRLSEAGYNCILPYSSLKLGKGIDGIRQVLDLCPKYGIKVIFSVKDQYPGKLWAINELDGVKGPYEVTRKVVTEFRNHPAILSWYLSDEESRSEVPKMTRLRELISAIDPWHPVYTLTREYADLPYYAMSGDTLGVDPYPIRKTNFTMKYLGYALSQAMLSNTPIWVVPQVFNWGVYEAKSAEHFKDGFRFPTAVEMRSMALLSAARGAKGFVFYSYFDVWEADKFAPGSSQAEWPKIAELGGIMREMEPYIMGKAAIKRIKLEPGSSELVEAAILTADDGRTAVIVTSEGPGPARAAFKLPAGDYESRFGRVKKNGAGIYEFTGNDIDSDVLFLK